MKTRLLALGFVFLLAMVTVPAQASGRSQYSARGNVLSYANPGIDPGAVVVGGNWDYNLYSYTYDPQSHDATFTMWYKEKNLNEGEQAPIGTVDQFRITLTTIWWVEMSKDSFWLPADSAFIVGQFKYDKMAWLPEGSRPAKEHDYNFISNKEGQLIITPGGFWLNLGYYDGETFVTEWGYFGSVQQLRNNLN